MSSCPSPNTTVTLLSVSVAGSILGDFSLKSDLLRLPAPVDRHCSHLRAHLQASEPSASHTAFTHFPFLRAFLGVGRWRGGARFPNSDLSPHCGSFYSPKGVAQTLPPPTEGRPHNGVSVRRCRCKPLPPAALSVGLVLGAGAGLSLQGLWGRAGRKQKISSFQSL